jgi:hypothetical protein
MVVKGLFQLELINEKLKEEITVLLIFSVFDSLYHVSRDFKEL